jgi:hypothetical protein
MIVEGKLAIKIEAKPVNEFGRGDSDLGSVDDGVKGGRGIVEFLPGEMYKVAFIRVNLHADRSEKLLSSIKDFIKNNYVLVEGIGYGEETNIINI